ncbi:MAG: hypothetical protein ACTTJE_07400 [Schwartzia sp. (in: firmicutes)]
MTMIFAIAAAALATALLFFFPRRFFPKRRPVAFLLFLLAGGALFFTAQESPRPSAVSAAEKAHIAAQQAAVATWYANHQRLIEGLDHNWQQYHRILSDFSEDLIDLETAHERLTALESAAAEEKARVKDMTLPAALDETNRDMVEAIRQKTERYAAAQHNAIRLTALAADPERQTSRRQEEQSRRLRDVMITESPAGLFLATELTALRQNLRTPE